MQSAEDEGLSILKHHSMDEAFHSRRNVSGMLNGTTAMQQHTVQQTQAISSRAAATAHLSPGVASDVASDAPAVSVAIEGLMQGAAIFEKICVYPS